MDKRIYSAQNLLGRILENRRDDIRNIAIIAHVDHGKTTLVDQLLKQSGLFRDNEKVDERIMDSNAQEKERGITILAKNASFNYKSYKINIVDTPGHADFSGEVERILKMVDGVCLVVDSFEGAMPQTKFVTRKALQLGIKPIVVINKIDREGARPEYVLNQVYDLFLELDASEEQLDFPVIYASGRAGYAQYTLAEKNIKNDMEPLYETIIKAIPGPICYPEAPLQVLVTNLDYSDYLGRLGIGRIWAGSMNINDPIICINKDNKQIKGRIAKMFVHSGLKRIEATTAVAGEIVIWSGLEEMTIGDTVCAPENPTALERISIDEPTMVMNFIVNDSPFAGKEGDHVTSRKIRDRLFKEAVVNVALRVEETEATDTFKVTGRGELHLTVLIENMRREGYEFQVSKPRVIFKEIDGIRHEPIEELTIDVPESNAGTIIDVLGRRKGEMTHMETQNGNTRMLFLIPARGLIGFRSMFMTLTRGYGSMSSIFNEYKPYKGEIASRSQGVMIAMEDSETNGFAMFNLQDRGTMFLAPGIKVYKGQIVAEHQRDNDLTVSIGKKKQLTNMRASGSDDNIMLTPPRRFTLEQAIDYINEDELVEITPESIRLRKKYLDENDRKRYSRTKE